MKKKLLLMLSLSVMLVCLFAICVSAESVYVNSKGEQVEADSADIAYELEILNPWEKTSGKCNVRYIYLHDTSVTKIVIPAIKLTHSNGTVYNFAEYSYLRLSTGWNGTLGVYALADKDTKSNSLHAQIKELEFHVPVLGDGAGTAGNLANWTSLEKLSFYSRAYEPQNKGGFLHNCTSLKEIHFYGENNELSGNFFPSVLNDGGKIVFHENATGVIRNCAMQGINGKDITVYMNTKIKQQTQDDPRLTWNKKNDALKFVLLVEDSSGYTSEEIASYETFWQAGNNKNANNAKYSMPIQTYCEYYGTHIGYEEPNACIWQCTVCLKSGALQNPQHNIETVIDYANGYLANGIKTVGCTNEGCGHGETITLAPLFTSKGYSQDEKSNAVVLDFNADRDAIKAYEEYHGTKISYGVVASLAKDEYEGSPLNADASAKDGAIAISFENTEFELLQLKLTGIDKKDDALYCCGYIAFNGSVSYINGDAIAQTALKISYNNYTGIPNEEQ